MPSLHRESTDSLITGIEYITEHLLGRLELFGWHNSLLEITLSVIFVVYVVIQYHRS